MDGSDTRTAYQYDGSQMLTETGPSTSQYLWGPGGLVRRDGEWPLTDGMGSTRVVTNGSQSITSTQLPDAYGQSVTSSGSTSLPYQWGGSSGYRSDLDAGLIQVGARYYDKDSGRFITRDTDMGQEVLTGPALARVGLADLLAFLPKTGHNAYAYCNGDPINLTDPTGHFFIVVLVIVAFGIVIYILYQIYQAAKKGGGARTHRFERESGD